MLQEGEIEGNFLNLWFYYHQSILFRTIWLAVCLNSVV